MSTTDVDRSGESTPSTPLADLRLEAVVIPVSDVDRSKAFYAGLGWRLDADCGFDNGFRVVQLTPPGSAASVHFGTNISTAAPGSAQGLYLVVSAQAELLPQITTPVTIINGRHDRVVPVANAEFLDERPNSRLAIIDAGHFVWEEAPAEYASITLDSISRAGS
jgi:pimeloyl-ACP methyl ester carboxylesterase